MMIRLLIITICLLSLTACNDYQYLWHSVHGHLQLMARAKPIERVLLDPNVDQLVKNRLDVVVEIREFAKSTLYLPDNGSYYTYADLERPYAVWNLVAAPEFSLDLYQWCYPVLGCVTYRGHFEQETAQMEADLFSATGYDFDVYGVQAYSTLSWFDDPVLNTFLTDDEIRLSALLFHEMAHQVVYAKDDTVFNESFAKTIEREGVRRWCEHRKSETLWRRYRENEIRSNEFVTFLAGVRDELEKVYTAEQDSGSMRKAKENTIADAYSKYDKLKKAWGDYEGYDKWMARGLNNARLATVSTYNALVPELQDLLEAEGYNFGAFYSKVKSLADLSVEERHAQLKKGHIRN